MADRMFPVQVYRTRDGKPAQVRESPTAGITPAACRRGASAIAIRMIHTVWFSARRKKNREKRKLAREAKRKQR